MEKDIVDPLIEPTEPEQRHEQPINQPPAPKQPKPVQAIMCRQCRQVRLYDLEEETSILWIFGCVGFIPYCIPIPICCCPQKYARCKTCQTRYRLI